MDTTPPALIPIASGSPTLPIFPPFTIFKLPFNVNNVDVASIAIAILPLVNVLNTILLASELSVIVVDTTSIEPKSWVLGPSFSS